MMARTTMSDAAKIKRIADRHEGDGWSYYHGYSGRGMFGDRCPGITCPPCDVRKVEAAVRKAGIKASASGDSMGRDSIVYWPSVSCDGVETCPGCGSVEVNPHTGACDECSNAAYDAACPCMPEIHSHD